MTQIDYVDDAVQVDANVLAQAFAISTERLKLGMREGVITSRFEKGEGDDAGKVRLTFFSTDRRVRMIADQRGTVLTCSAVNFRKPLPDPSATPSRSHEASAGDNGGGVDEATPADRRAAEEFDAARRARLDALLDEALADTFPASDPIAISFGPGR